MVFHMFTEFCNLHNLIFESFHHFKKTTISRLSPPTPCPLGSHSSSFCPHGFASSGHFISLRSHTMCSLGTGFFDLVFSRFIHVESVSVLYSFYIYTYTHTHIHTHTHTHIHIYIWLLQVLVAVHGIFSYGMQDLAPSPGMEPRPPAMGAQSFSHSATREVSILQSF